MEIIPKVSLFILTVILFLTLAGEQQERISYPPASQKQTIIQTVGDAEIKMVFHGPNV